MSAAVRRLNRKVHIYLGLALLLFIVLFSATGLLLNHHFAFAEFWPKRAISTYERAIRPPRPAGDIAMARDLMGQLGVRGEIVRTELAPGGQLKVQVARPGRNVAIEADLAAGRAKVEETKVNGWGVVRTLHTFIGVSLDDPARRRDWWLTSLWSLAIDLTCAGLVVLVLSGLYEAWTSNAKRAAGLTVLAVASAVCAAFVLGLFP